MQRDDFKKRELKNGVKLYLKKGDKTTWSFAFEGIISELQAMIKDEDLLDSNHKEDQVIDCSVGYEISFKRIENNKPTELVEGEG